MLRFASSATRFLVALAVLSALLLGVPLVLAIGVGWPLPESIRWADIRRALGGSTVSDATILKAFALVGWVAWAQVVVTAAAEVSAWVRGRASRSVPLAGPIQPIIRSSRFRGAATAGCSSARR
jgi:hypothetical protein